MTLDMANTDKLNRLPPGCDAAWDRGGAAFGADQLPPFETGENTIFYALAAIKGVGEAAVDHIVEVRGDTPFASLEDFCQPHRSAPSSTGARWKA
jgi:DNA polymerase-3 subunit alpha